MVDEHGFPTNPAYLEAQGLDVVTLNQALVTAQDELDQLSYFFAQIADPATRAQALADFDAALGGQEEGGGQVQRPAFPGVYSENSGNDPIRAWQQAREFGFPAGQEQQAQQLWSQVPAGLQARAILENLANL